MMDSENVVLASPAEFFAVMVKSVVGKEAYAFPLMVSFFPDRYNPSGSDGDKNHTMPVPLH